MNFVQIEEASYPIHYGHSVLKKMMAKYGLKKFIELGKLVEMLEINDMPKFIKDGFDTGAKVLGNESPFTLVEVEEILEKNVWLESEALEVFAKCIQRPKPVEQEEGELVEAEEKN